MTVVETENVAPLVPPETYRPLLGARKFYYGKVAASVPGAYVFDSRVPAGFNLVIWRIGPIVTPEWISYSLIEDSSTDPVVYELSDYLPSGSKTMKSSILSLTFLGAYRMGNWPSPGPLTIRSERHWGIFGKHVAGSGGFGMCAGAIGYLIPV